MADHQRFIAELAGAIRSYRPLPAFPSGLTLQNAYAMLPEVAAAICDSGSPGLKAGLTNPGLQQMFGLDSALLGRLYDWGELKCGASLPSREHSLIECELCVMLGADGVPFSIGPAIEFVHLNFSRADDFTPANLVVSSLGADRYLLGEQLPWNEEILASLGVETIRLERDGEKILEVSCNDSLSGPESAVRWCIDEARKRGLAIEENTLLLTGTCGAALPAIPGSYCADFGALGAVAFEIEPAPG